MKVPETRVSAQCASQAIFVECIFFATPHSAPQSHARDNISQFLKNSKSTDADAFHQKDRVFSFASAIWGPYLII
jgi:hypothetical protein